MKKTEVATAALELAGFASIVWGVFLLSVAAGFIACGVALIIVALGVSK